MTRPRNSKLTTHNSVTLPFRFDYVRPGRSVTSFDSTLLHCDDHVLVLTHEVHPSRPIEHFGREVLGDGYTAVWFLFKGEPWDVARFYRPDGEWTGYYADVLEPVHWDGADARTLRPLVDRILDLWIEPDLRYEILDEDELAAALQDGHITESDAERARQALQLLVNGVQSGSFPPPLVRSYQRPIPPDAPSFPSPKTATIPNHEQRTTNNE